MSLPAKWKPSVSATKLRPAIDRLPTVALAERESVPELLSESALALTPCSSIHPASSFTSPTAELDVALTKPGEVDVCALLVAAPRSAMSINPVGGGPVRCGRLTPLFLSAGAS